MKRLRAIISCIVLLSALPATAISSTPDSKIFVHENRAEQPPTKAVIKSKPEPHYPEEARRRHVEGTIVLRAIFRSSGKVTDIKFSKAIPENMPEDIVKILTRESIKAAGEIKFEPATRDGHPVSMYMQLEFNFHPY